MNDSIKSVLNPDKTRYEKVDGWYDTGLLVWAYGQFDTYGDGDTKHSHTHKLGREQFTDFCLSVARHITENPLELVHSYEFGMDKISRESYQFLLSVKYDESKRKWFSFSLSKVSTSDTKRYDKRWTEVPTWADGAPKSAWQLYRFVRESSGSLLERYSILERFRELAGGCFYGQDECETWIAELKGDHQQAYRALEAAVRGASALEYAKRAIASAIYNSTPKAEPVAEPAVTAEPVAA